MFEIFEILIPRLGSDRVFDFFAFAWGGVLALCVAGVGREGVGVAGSFKYCFRIIQNFRSDCF